MLSRMKKATRPEKTLQSMKEGKGINMSDPDIADEFARFMKETDPKGTKDIEEKILLESFDPKRTKGNADGGRIGLKGGLSKAFLEFLKNTGKNMNNKSPLQFGKDYLKNVKDKTLKANETGKFMDLPIAEVGIPATTGALVNNQVKKKLEAMNEEQKEENLKRFIMELENDEFYQKYPDLKDETIASYTEKLFGEKKADGGRIGLVGGTNEDFQKYLKERERFEKERSLEQLFREYKEDLRRQEVGEQKQMAADGGRIGLKAGMTKRAFMKLMGSTAAGIGAVKSGIFSGFGKGATKQAAKEVAQQTTSSMPPPYFFKLAEKIKMMGDDVTATTDRTIAKKLPSKDGKSEYLLEENITTGDTSIKKIYKEDDNMITDVEIMEFRKGEDVITKDGKPIKTPDEYEEVTEVNKRIYKDNYNASDYTDGINVDEIIKEVDDQAPPIKYASGGLAYMLGE